MLPCCWEIKRCGRQEGGEKVEELGVCPAYPDHGHSCWLVAGTFCKGRIQGAYAQKHKMCVSCEVYSMYSLFCGSKKEELIKEYHDEYKRSKELLKELRT